LGDAVELAFAEPADRAFPARLSESLGVCLKIGREHEVWSDGKWTRYPADAICVRTPGTVWSCTSTGSVGFHSIDIDAAALPQPIRARPMSFLPSHRVPELQAVFNVLQKGRSLLLRQEAVAALVLALDAVIHSDTLRETPAASAVARARELLTARMTSPPTLDELSRATETNKFVLLRRFKRELGVTPHRYLVALRLNRARELLARGVAAADVASILGFADQAHFTRAFKSSVGLTPNRYARLVRTMVTLP
jgi:AraC-like DNA-binding protein